MPDDGRKPEMVVRMLGKRQYALLFDGRELARLTYEEALPIIAGRVDKVQLLASYGVTYEET